ncbi:YbaB/EbfC family nucleoid-associated protein [Nocardia cerradoensis]|uniref:YbaB/EbfC family nucleoid-associated protein n=1 Tax=Nocardia cerradoensis TaxID=85688 RepID=UPI00117EE737|nr:YbaB/EbfC family nucleoid-associated protein [Nocardia cerradoensis]
MVAKLVVNLTSLTRDRLVLLDDSAEPSLVDRQLLPHFDHLAPVADADDSPSLPPVSHIWESRRCAGWMESTLSIQARSAQRTAETECEPHGWGKPAEIRGRDPVVDPLSAGDDFRYLARTEVNQLLDNYEEQMASLAEIRRRLDSLRIQARSTDGTIEVSVDSAGVVTEIKLEPAAMRNKPEDLARKLTEVIREAAMHAEKHTAEAVAPVSDIVDPLPDLPDLLPGAPSLRNPVPPEDDPEDAAPTR